MFSLSPEKIEVLGGRSATPRRTPRMVRSLAAMKSSFWHFMCQIGQFSDQKADFGAKMMFSVRPVPSGTQNFAYRNVYAKFSVA